jgi:hypothetical protein
MTEPVMARTMIIFGAGRSLSAIAVAVALSLYLIRLLSLHTRESRTLVSGSLVSVVIYYLYVKSNINRLRKGLNYGIVLPMNREPIGPDGAQKPVNPLPDEYHPDAGFVVMEKLIAIQFEDMQQALSMYANDPGLETQNGLAAVATSHNSSVRIALQALEAEEEGTIEDRINDMMFFILHLEEMRADYLNAIAAEGEEYKPISEDQLRELRKHLFQVQAHKESNGGLDLDDEFDSEGSDCTATAHLMEIYVDSMLHDVTQFTNKKLEVYNQLPSTKRRRMIRTFGYHALDVAKTSAGVVIGGITLGALAKGFKFLK